MAVGLQRSGDGTEARCIYRCAAPPANHRCAVGLLHSELRRRVASRRALPCTSSFFVDQSSSRHVEKFGEDILTSPDDIRAQTLNFKANFKFSRLKMFGGGTPVPVVVCAIKPWSISSVYKNLRGQHPLKAEM